WPAAPGRALAHPVEPVQAASRAVGPQERGRGGAMNQFIRAIHWIFTPANWDSVNLQAGIRSQLAYHVELAAISILAAAAIAIPAGMIVGHRRRGQFLAVSVANIGRAIPS